MGWEKVIIERDIMWWDIVKSNRYFTLSDFYKYINKILSNKTFAELDNRFDTGFLEQKPPEITPEIVRESSIYDIFEEKDEWIINTLEEIAGKINNGLGANYSAAEVFDVVYMYMRNVRGEGGAGGLNVNTNKESVLRDFSEFSRLLGAMFSLFKAGGVSISEDKQDFPYTHPTYLKDIIIRIEVQLDGEKYNVIDRLSNLLVHNTSCETLTHEETNSTICLQMAEDNLPLFDKYAALIMWAKNSDSQLDDTALFFNYWKYLTKNGYSLDAATGDHFRYSFDTLDEYKEFIRWMNKDSMVEWDYNTIYDRGSILEVEIVNFGLPLQEHIQLYGDIE